MTRKIILAVAFISMTALSNTAFAQANQSQRVSVTVKDSNATNKKDTLVGPPSITHHQISVNGKTISYTASAGYMPMKDNKDDKLIAKLFYVAYTADNAGNKSKRPVTFVFNGGPGSSSIWLHMGSFGPVRVKFGNDKRGCFIAAL